MGDFGGETVWTRLAALPPERLIPYLGAQAPQTVAALLLLLPPERAAVLLAGLPEDLRARALRCMAVTRPAAPDVLADMERVLCADLLDPSARAPDADRSAEVMRIVEALPAEQHGAAMEAL
jgi:Flagellar motor switch protein